MSFSVTTVFSYFSTSHDGTTFYVLFHVLGSLKSVRGWLKAAISCRPHHLRALYKICEMISNCAFDSYITTVSGSEMDFTAEGVDCWQEPELQAHPSRRRAVVYHEEDSLEQSSDDGNKGCADSADSTRNHGRFATSAAFEMTIRYVVTWTQVIMANGSKQIQQTPSKLHQQPRLKTHSISLDVMSHLTVLEVIDMAVRGFARVVPAEPTFVECFREEMLSYWECRFSRNDGLPRFDYPCSCLLTQRWTPLKSSTRWPASTGLPSSM